MALLPAWTGDFDAARPLLRAAFHGEALQSPFANFAGPVAHEFQFPHPQPEALADDARISQLIRYSVALIESMRSYRAHRMLDTLLRREGRQLSAMQRSFLLFRRAFARYRMLNAYERDPELIIEDYELAVRIAEEAPWCDHSLFLAGNVAGNLALDVDRARELWGRVFDDYPAGSLAPNAAMYIAGTYEDEERWIEAYDIYFRAYDRDPAGMHAEMFAERIADIERRVPEDQRRELRDPTPAESE